MNDLTQQKLCDIYMAANSYGQFELTPNTTVSNYFDMVLLELKHKNINNLKEFLYKNHWCQGAYPTVLNLEDICNNFYKALYPGYFNNKIKGYIEE